MPLKFSHACWFAVEEGSSNSFRYHQDGLYGLPAGVGRFANCAPIGYVTPGTPLRFIPVKRFGNWPSSTSPPNTVPGTVAACQPVVEKPAREIASPPAATEAEDWIVQPVASGTRVASA